MPETRSGVTPGAAAALAIGALLSLRHAGAYHSHGGGAYPHLQRNTLPRIWRALMWITASLPHFEQLIGHDHTVSSSGGQPGRTGGGEGGIDAASNAARHPFGGGHATPHSASCARVHPPLGVFARSISSGDGIFTSARQKFSLARVY
jgi:hypothetical protein